MFVDFLWLRFNAGTENIYKKAFFVSSALKTLKNLHFQGFKARREGDSGRFATFNARREAVSVHREGGIGENGTFNGRRETGNPRRASDTARGDARPTQNGISAVQQEVASGRQEDDENASVSGNLAS